MEHSTTKKEKMIKKTDGPEESFLKPLLKQYLAPAGVGVLIGAAATLSTTLPKIFDSAKKISAEKRKLKIIEADISAYSKVVSRFREILPKEDMLKLFPDDAKTLYIYDRPGSSEDDRVSVSLKQSSEGAYFLWTESSYNSELAAARFGKWLTRSEAMLWAQSYIPLVEFKKIFDTEDVNYIDTTIKIDLY